MRVTCIACNIQWWVSGLDLGFSYLKPGFWGLFLEIRREEHPNKTQLCQTGIAANTNNSDSWIIHKENLGICYSLGVKAFHQGSGLHVIRVNPRHQIIWDVPLFISCSLFIKCGHMDFKFFLKEGVAIALVLNAIYSHTLLKYQYYTSKYEYINTYTSNWSIEPSILISLLSHQMKFGELEGLFL
jgi:hypothetical protein